MSLIKWNKRFNTPSFSSLMDDFFTDDFSPSFATTSFFPQANIEETDKAFKLELAIPGQSKEDINVEVDNGLLTISAEKEESKEEKEKNYTRKEYNYSSFRRSFSLPENVESDKIEASYENGILILVAPKSVNVENESKKIEVI